MKICYIDLKKTLIEMTRLDQSRKTCYKITKSSFWRAFSVSYFFLFFFCASFLQALETKIVSKLGVTEITLRNGLKVVLKPTDFDDEIFFRFTALGGYACLPLEKQISGELASQVVMESGLGKRTGDQLSVFLYEHSLEFNPQILPFSRVIEGSTIKEELEPFFEISNAFFTEPRFDKEGFQNALERAKTNLNKRPLDFDTTFDEVFFRTNTQNNCAHCAKKLSKLSQVDFSLAKDLYFSAFGNPKDFVLVIVGSFEMEEMLKLVKQYLDFEVNQPKPFEKKQIHQAVFPAGITSVKVPFYSRTDSLTRMTFPIKSHMDEEKLRHLALACQVMEIRLRNLMRTQMDTTFGLDVAYEFPFFPYLDHPWITIQFRCEPEKVSKIKELILGELTLLQKQNLTEDEFNEAKIQQKHSDEFWLRDNYFWVGALSNYYIWDWDPKNIVKNLDDTQTLSKGHIQSLLQTSFSLSQYSIISAELIR